MTDFVRKEGWLMKTGGRVKTWKTRYFRLRTNTGMLEYSKQPDADSPLLGSVPVKGAIISMFTTGIYKKHPIAFGVTPAGKGDAARTYVMEAANVDERAAWVEALREVAGAKPVDPPATDEKAQPRAGALKEGELTRLGGHSGNWTRRFAVLSTRSLLFFAKQTDLALIREVDLSRGAILSEEREASFALPYAFSVVTPGSGLSSSSAPAMDKKEKGKAKGESSEPLLVTSVSGPGLSPGSAGLSQRGQRCVLSANSPEDRDAWMSEIRDVINSCLYGVGHTNPLHTGTAHSPS